MSLESVVKVVSGDGTWAGTGFVVSKTHIMTCAHVVAEVLSETTDEAKAMLADPSPPTGEIELIFMEIEGQGIPATGTVFIPPESEGEFAKPGWSPKKNSLYERAFDVAVLEVIGGVPPHAKPVSVHQAIPADDQKIHAYGPPAESIYGAVEATVMGSWGKGLITGADGNNLYGLGKDPNVDVGTFIHAGFSGSAVFKRGKDDPALLGLITQADDAEKRARMVSTAALREIYPDLGNASGDMATEFRTGTDEIWPLYFVNRGTQQSKFNRTIQRQLGAVPGHTNESTFFCVLEATPEDVPFGFSERLRLSDIGKRTSVKPTVVVFKWNEYEDADDAIDDFYDKLVREFDAPIDTPQDLANVLNTNNQPVILRMEVAEQRYHPSNEKGLQAFVEVFTQLAKLQLNNEVFFILTFLVSPATDRECELTKLLHGDLRNWLADVPHCFPKRMGSILTADLQAWLTELTNLNPEQEWRSFFKQNFDALYGRVHRTFPENGELSMSAFIAANKAFREGL